MKSRTAVIGVVIRTLDESEHIGRCLETLQGQHGGFELDVLVVDSGSTDATVEIAKSHGVRVVNVPPHEFGYSKTLNFGIDNVHGDVVVCLSAHAVPLDAHWLERMTAPFDDDRVAGVASRQVPWPDAPWQELHRLRQQFGEDGRVYSDENAQEIAFSNAASSIRRSVWREYPFTLPIGEDLDWARRVVAAGWTVVYEARAEVYHSHHEGPRAQALRMLDFNRAHLSGERPRSRWRGIREAVGMLLRDSRKIFSLDDPLRRKAGYLVELLSMVSYYVVDSSRAGTIAERRQQVSGRRPPEGVESMSSKSERGDLV